MSPEKREKTGLPPKTNNSEKIHQGANVHLGVYKRDVME
jgi:hypothetical protein